MPRVIVHVKEVTRLRVSTGVEEQAFVVVDIDLFVTGKPIEPNPGADFAYLHGSDGTVANGWYRDGATPPNFNPDPDLVDPTSVAPPVTIEDAKAVTAAALTTVQGVASELERLLLGLNGIQG